MTNKNLGVILARGGSKSIPYKNLTEFMGKPLLFWTIDAALKSKYIDEVIVSSDSEEIIKRAREYGANAFMRPSELATDKASSLDALIHTVLEASETGQNYEFITLLQPTSPLRSSEDIDSAFKKIISANASSLISVYTPDFAPQKAFIINSSGYLSGIINDNYPFMNRQSLEKTFYSNGAIYIIKQQQLLKYKSFITEKTIPYEMDRDCSIDIDTLEDLKAAERIYIEKNSQGTSPR